MSDKDGNTTRGRGRLPALDTIQGVRKALAKTARSLWRGEIEDGRARSLSYVLSTLSAAFKVESELAIEGRVAELERIQAEREASDAAQAG